jgi:carboxymethylenebutenolidase
MAHQESKREIQTETISLTVGDGSQMRAYVARPQPISGVIQKCPAIIVFQEAFGVNKHIRDVVHDFAQSGFVAIAPELFHRTASPGFEDPNYNFPMVMPHYQAVTPQTIEADAKACYDWLKSQNNVNIAQLASIGFCMGGKSSYVANSVLPMAAAVSFYGGGIAPDLLHLAEKQKAPILLVWGGLDKHIPFEQTRAVDDALTKAGKTFVTVTFADADHAFSNNDRPSFQPRATHQAMTLTKAFLHDHLRL